MSHPVRPVVCRRKRLISAEDMDPLDKTIVCRGCSEDVLIGWDIQDQMSKDPRYTYAIVCEECYQKGLLKTLEKQIKLMPPHVREEFNAKLRAEMSRLFKKDGPNNTIGGIDSGLLR